MDSAKLVEQAEAFEDRAIALARAVHPGEIWASQSKQMLSESADLLTCAAALRAHAASADTRRAKAMFEAQARPGYKDAWWRLSEEEKRAWTAIAMARESAETACPAPVPKDCQARCEAIAQEQPLEPKD